MFDVFTSVLMLIVSPRKFIEHRISLHIFNRKELFLIVVIFLGMSLRISKRIVYFPSGMRSEEGGLAVKTNAGGEGGEGGVIGVLGGGGGCETDCTERVDAKVLT